LGNWIRERIGYNSEKSFNNKLGNLISDKRRWMNVNKRIMALALLTLVAFVAVIGGFLMTTQAAATTVTTDTSTANVVTATVDDNNTEFPCWINGGMGFGGPGPRGGPRGGFGGFGPIQVSAEFEQNVTNIANGDTDVQTLLTEGYNITSVRPIIKSVVDANGYVTTKATSAIVTLQKDTSGRANVLVNLEEGKVTKIVILTRTVIEKP
jgi:hypothetical protein